MIFISVILTGFLTSVNLSTRAQEAFPSDNMPDIMPGTVQLTMEGDLSSQMMDGAHKFIERKTDESVNQRSQYWNRNLTSGEVYEASTEPNRKRFMQYIGVIDKSLPYVNYNKGLEDKYPPVVMERVSYDSDPALIAETSEYRIYQVRWPVFNRVNGEGILLQPKTAPAGNIIALPDADQTPEQLAGLAQGIPEGSQFARHLAENGYQVLIPVLVDRTYLFPGTTQQQTYRERVYRQAFHMGRHIIGYEVQKILSAIDWFKQSEFKNLKTGVAGYGEGGLLAFYAGAVDKRIDAVMVSGYFTSREKVWDEPIYRNVWALLTEFGDAEIATLIAPRPLVVEYSHAPEIYEDVEKYRNNPIEANGFPFTGYKGQLKTPPFADVESEFNKIDKLVKPGFMDKYLIRGKDNTPVNFASSAALEKFAAALGQKNPKPLSGEVPADNRNSFNPEERQFRQVKELEDHVQWLMRISDMQRNTFFLDKVMPEYATRRWSTRSYHPFYPSDKVVEKGKEYRDYFHEEILGKFNEEMLPQNTKTRKIYDNDRWAGYEVVMDVYPELFAWGILLIPKDIQPGEQRPVVVCQHGRSSVPQYMVEGNLTAYNNTAAKLADKGFITYAPHNLYRGEDRYRWLDRKANTVKTTLFSFIISQHDQTLKWLGSLPFVDKERIAFYGLSYGGETAMRVPAVLEDYCLSICSGDFGDWTRKITDVYGRTFMQSMEWEMPYFNMGSTFSYAEMAYLIFPRPFMVERGNDDLVQPNEWVAYEYGKVKYFYDHYGMGDRTDIEFFNGGHSMKGEGTFRFLHKHLNWP